MLGWLRYLFTEHAPVGRRAYLLTGIACGAVKYADDALIVYAATGARLSARDLVLGSRLSDLAEPRLRNVALAAMLAWSLPFLWISYSWSVRRAADAGLSPWLAMLMFVPIVKLLLIAGLCIAPSREPHAPRPRRDASKAASALRMLVASGIGLLAGIPTFAAAFWVPQGYGMTLFVATPFCMGLVTAYVLQVRGPAPMVQSILAGLLSPLLAAALLLTLALEGAVCIAMILPAAMSFAVLGALAGHFMAEMTREKFAPTFVVVLGLPGISGLESLLSKPVEFETITAVEIDVPPEQVWPHVIAFSELPPPTERIFRLGIACPMRARIEGAGVGAVRHCEFTTGAFVEPITRWEPPTRLSFDVTEQPEPLRELSPWGAIHPPHLDGGWRSLRGEFRLVALPGGRTRLEGSTWCELAYAPSWYWRPQAEWIVHAIHGRVLRHVKQLAEG